MHCPNCGSPVEQGKPTCEECGADLRTQSGDAQPHGEQPRDGKGGRPQRGQGGPPQGQGGQPQRGQQGWGSRRPPQRQPPDQQRRGGPQDDDSISRRALFAGGGVLAVVAAGGAFLFLQDSGDGESPDTPGSSFEDAPTISSGQHGPYEISDGGRHYFAVNLEEGDRLTVTMEFSHDEGDLDLIVYGPNQSVPEGRSVSFDDDESVTTEASMSGTYYLSPRAFGDDSNGYELDIEVA